MSDEKTYTEREKVLAERKAFDHGYEFGLRFTNCRYDRPTLDHTIATRYPLPKVTRPRVWRDAPDRETGSSREFRYCQGQLQTRVKEWHTDWRCLTNGTAYATANPDGFAITPARIAAWADLMANPTEEVEANA